MSRTAFLGKGVNNPEESLNIDNTYLHVIYKLLIIVIIYLLVYFLASQLECEN